MTVAGDHWFDLAIVKQADANRDLGLLSGEKAAAIDAACAEIAAGPEFMLSGV